LNELALFAGAGGGILGGKLLGWRTVCAVEINTFCARRLMQRQNEGHLAPFPIWDDVCTFDGHPWRSVVDVVSGGFPCQDISAAGTGEGLDGARSGLWVEMARIISEIRPAFCFVENSPMLTIRGLGRVLGDLAALGYDAEWGVLGASDVGAPHLRERIWILAHSTTVRLQRIGDSGESSGESSGELAGGEVAGSCDTGIDGVADTDSLRELQPQGSKQEQRRWIGDSGSQVADSYEIGRGGRAGMLRKSGRLEPENGGDDVFNASSRRHGTPESEICSRWYSSVDAGWWTVEPDVGRVAHGVAARVDRLQALGNGQVPLCHAEAWLRLLARFRF